MNMQLIFLFGLEQKSKVDKSFLVRVMVGAIRVILERYYQYLRNFMSKCFLKTPHLENEFL